MKNLDYCKYTYIHRKALFFFIENCKYLTNEEKKELLKRAKIHDMDKLTLYLFWEKNNASKYHRGYASHHNRNSDNKFDILESIFDFECAGLTKPDKPLNAYDTLCTYFPECYNKYLPYLKRLHMDSSYVAISNEAIKYISQFNVTEDEIYKEVIEYLTTNQENIYTELGDLLCSKEEYEQLISRNIQ